MPVEAKVFRCEEDNPNRCQATAGKGQCPYLAESGGKYCPLHCGNSLAKKKKNEEEIELYRLNSFQARLKELSTNPKVKTLRDEVSILRMTLESVMTACNSQAELYLQHNKIADLVGKIEKVVVSCNMIEHKNGQMLDKSEVLKMVDAILQILTNYIEDADTLRSISNEVLGLFGES